MTWENAKQAAKDTRRWKSTLEALTPQGFKKTKSSKSYLLPDVLCYSRLREQLITDLIQNLHTISCFLYLFQHNIIKKNYNILIICCCCFFFNSNSKLNTNRKNHSIFPHMYLHLLQLVFSLAVLKCHSPTAKIIGR